MKSSPAVRPPCRGRPLFLLLAYISLACSAPGHRSWEAEVYIPSDSEANIFLLLHPDG